MRRNPPLHRIAVVLLAVSGCTGDAIGPGIGAGLRLASLDAGGVPPLAAEGDPRLETGTGVEFVTFAAARDTAGTLALWGFESSGATGQLFVLQVLDNRAGVYENCGQDLNPACHGRYIVGIRESDVGMHDAWYEVVDGEVVVADVGGGRVAGAFDVSLRDRDAGGAEIQVSGEFNVAVLEGASAAAMGCFGEEVAGSGC